MLVESGVINTRASDPWTTDASDTSVVPTVMTQCDKIENINKWVRYKKYIDFYYNVNWVYIQYSDAIQNLSTATEEHFHSIIACQVYPHDKFNSLFVDIWKLLFQSWLAKNGIVAVSHVTHVQGVQL